MKCHHRSEVSGGQRAATLQFNNFVKNFIMHQLLLNLETVTICNHWNLLEYICRRVKCIPFNCSLNPISSNHNMSRIQYRQSLLPARFVSRASIYKPLGRLRPRSDETPGEIFIQLNTDQIHETKYTIVCTHCMVKLQNLQSCLRPRV